MGGPQFASELRQAGAMNPAQAPASIVEACRALDAYRHGSCVAPARQGQGRLAEFPRAPDSNGTTWRLAPDRV